MDTKIEEIVDCTIQYTLEILAEDPTRWPIAARGIAMMIHNLAKDAPDHPALARLRAFSAAQQADYVGDAR